MEFGNDCKLIVGVDYGTTSTGVSYALTGSSQCNEVISIQKWPPNCPGLKVPSLVACAGSPGRSLWGFEVRPGMKSFAWTKLLLDPTFNCDSFKVEIREVAGALGILKLPEDRDAEEVVTEFLRHVHQHVCGELKRFLFDTMSPGRVPIEFWMTFPATWSEAVQSKLKRAASEAGFGDKVFTVSEPEAAALAVFRISKDFELNVGDGVLICDCGGGTVDVTSCFITDMNERGVPYFEQLTEETGSNCGGINVDCNLYRLLVTKLGEDFKNLSTTMVGPGSNFMKEFEYIKRDFNGELPYTLTLLGPVPREITLSPGDLRGIFDPVLDRILSLILSQIKRLMQSLERVLSTSKIIFVDGFAGSPYLQIQLKSALRQQMAEVGVLVAPTPERMVACGATVKGLQGIVAQHTNAVDIMA
ncbi:hypothetical protein PHISCL_07386 [Aspergillus sclerotialis]|uniref:Hsp70 protein n=1 Tax=Aspergillus sclerotialis TaxID=2070753 RepID=A0A3A2ZFZ4_9EURO|nr:hypothetical protein PHISCL_07386 [Aspergillus sclerotialis]